MIKKLALTLLPLSKQPKLLFSSNKFVFSALSNKKQTKISSFYFCSHKKTESESDQIKKETKLNDLSNEELIELNTEDSIALVKNNIKKMEELRTKQEADITELREKLGFMSKHHNDSLFKEEQLLENIKIQEEELIRLKKRADKEIEDSKDYAISKIAKELLEFADSLKRCKMLAEEKNKEDSNDQYLKGIFRLHSDLLGYLKLYEIEEFDPINTPFDPNTSEGLVTIPTPPGYTKNNVATTMFTGFRIKSRLLRSAKVGIFV